MHDAHGNQDVRHQVAIHMRMEIAVKLHFPADIRLEDRLSFTEPVIPGLAHQRLGNSRDRCLHLNPAIPVDICHLGIAKPEDPDFFILPIDVARHFAADHQHAFFILT